MASLFGGARVAAHGRQQLVRRPAGAVRRKTLRASWTSRTSRTSRTYPGSMTMVPRLISKAPCGRLCACLAAVLALSWATSASAVTRDERGALKMLFWSTQGLRWTAKWDIQNEYSDPCLDSWYGVVCDRQGRIRSIRLPSNHLVGVLPAEFIRKGLSGLQELDLSSNFLTGRLPDSWSLLPELRTLRLDHNNFVGAVPVSLAQLTKLEFLELLENNFDPVDENGGVLPEEVQQLAHSPLRRCHIMA